MAGALILACFIISKVYGCILTAFVAMPISYPLIDSVQDLQNKGDTMHVNIDRDLSVDIIFRVFFKTFNLRPTMIDTNYTTGSRGWNFEISWRCREKRRATVEVQQLRRMFGIR